MSEWRVIKGIDSERNHCIYLQDGSDKTSRELFEFVEPDVMFSLPLQFGAYLEDAQAEADERNESDGSGGAAPSPRIE